MKRTTIRELLAWAETMPPDASVYAYEGEVSAVICRDLEGRTLGELVAVEPLDETQAARVRATIARIRERERLDREDRIRRALAGGDPLLARLQRR